MAGRPSCVAACLYDPVTGVGGMNHFLLPYGDAAQDPGRYGEHAMDLLIGALQRLGAPRGRLRAKVFGGAHVLAGPTRDDSVSSRNVRFIEQFFDDEGIPLMSKDLGGFEPRQVRFHVPSGRVQVRRLYGKGADVAPTEPREMPVSARGSVDLFS